eukprot:scaffold67414_cov48-Prasinocladus_malaysianus.AAC.1
MEAAVADALEKLAADAQAYLTLITEWISKAQHSGNTDFLEWSKEAREHHQAQLALWSRIIVLSSNKGAELLHALDNGKYPPLPASELLSLRPDPPGGRSDPVASGRFYILNFTQFCFLKHYYRLLSLFLMSAAQCDAGSDLLGKKELSAAEEYQAAKIATLASYCCLLQYHQAELGGALAARQQVKATEEASMASTTSAGGGHGEEATSTSSDPMAAELAAVLKRRTLTDKDKPASTPTSPVEGAKDRFDPPRGRASLPPTNQMNELQAALERRRRNSGHYYCPLQDMSCTVFFMNLAETLPILSSFMRCARQNASAAASNITMKCSHPPGIHLHQH